MRRAFALLAVGLALAWAGACSSHDRPGLASFDAGWTGGSGGGGFEASLSDAPPSPDATGLCGNLVVPVLADLPNLYFIVDRSGSMADALPGANYSKYENARIAIGKVLRAIGHRVKYGAATYPNKGGTIEGCAAGGEVFPTQQGDPPSYAASGVDGPVLLGILGALKLSPSGGTPTSATLAALNPLLTALPGKTFVVLATDGAPNCNLTASCTADECMLNIEGWSVNDVKCVAPVNCCSPSFAQGSQIDCVDRVASVSEVTKLADAGILTYVIGMPGSEAYSNVLDQMAIAGGTARPTAPLYYPVTDSASLSDAIKQIGIQVAIKCEVDLQEPPPDPTLVNVYFDTSLVQQDGTDGWSWTSESSLTLNGAACDKLKSGDVLQLQVVSGCPTSVK